MRTAARLIVCLVALCVALAAPSVAAAAVYLSPSGNDAAGCTAAAPCRSFDRGYRVAVAGDEVILAGGAYGDQGLVSVPAKGTGDRVVFHPDAGAPVTLGYLDVDNTHNVEIRGMATAGWGVTGGATNVVLRDLTILNQHDGGYFGGAHDVQVIGGEIGQIDPGDGIHFNNAHGNTNTNITIDRLYMHDLTRNRDPSYHTDCVQTGDVTGLVIRNSRFVNCATQGVFLNPYNGGATKDITIENNWFGPAQLGYNSLYIGDAHNVVVRNNSFTQNMYLSPTATNVSMVNNILGGMDAYSCQSTASNADVFDYNMSAAACAGAGHHAVNPGLLSQYAVSTASPAGALDLHLKSGAAAIDRGSPSSFAPTDIDGNGRPFGRAPDIGAHEYGAGPPPAPGAGGGGGDAGGTPPPAPAAPAPITSGLAGPLQGLPLGTAAALARLSDPRMGSKPPLTVAGFEQLTLCRRAARGCRQTSTRLRIVLTQAATLTARLRRVRPGHRARVVRVLHLKGRKGSNAFRIRSRGLARGRYDMLIAAHNGARVRLALRVR